MYAYILSIQTQRKDSYRKHLKKNLLNIMAVALAGILTAFSEMQRVLLSGSCSKDVSEDCSNFCLVSRQLFFL